MIQHYCQTALDYLHAHWPVRLRSRIYPCTYAALCLLFFLLDCASNNPGMFMALAGFAVSYWCALDWPWNNKGEVRP